MYTFVLCTPTSFSLLCGVVKQFAINTRTSILIIRSTAYRASILRFIAITQRIYHDKSQLELTIKIVTVLLAQKMFGFYILIYAQINPRLVALCKNNCCFVASERLSIILMDMKKKKGKEKYIYYSGSSPVRISMYKRTCTNKDLNLYFISLDRIICVKHMQNHFCKNFCKNRWNSRNEPCSEQFYCIILA